MHSGGATTDSRVEDKVRWWDGGVDAPLALASSSRVMGSSLGGLRTTGVLGSNFPVILIICDALREKNSLRYKKKR